MNDRASGRTRCGISNQLASLSHGGNRSSGRHFGQVSLAICLALDGDAPGASGGFRSRRRVATSRMSFRAVDRSRSDRKSRAFDRGVRSRFTLICVKDGKTNRPYSRITLANPERRVCGLGARAAWDGIVGRDSMRTLPWIAVLSTALAVLPAQAQTQSSATKPRAERPLTHHPQYVAPTGKRKPPGAPLDERKGTSPLLEHHEQEIRDHTLKSICKGAPGCEGGHLRPTEPKSPGQTKARSRSRL